MKTFLSDILVKAGITVQGTITGNSIVKSGGTSSQFLKADGSIDSNTYLTGITLSQVTSALGYTPPSGSGTSGYVSKFTGSGSLGNSSIYDSGTAVTIGNTNGLRAFNIYSSTADNHLAIYGPAPSVSLSDAPVGTYQAKFGLATASNQYATGAVAGDFVIISQTGSVFFNTNSINALKLTSTGAGVFNNSVTAGSFVKSGGTSSQFLKADGSVDSNTYLTSSALSSYLPLSGGTITGNLLVNGQFSITQNSTSAIAVLTQAGSGRIVEFNNSGALVAYVTNAGLIYGSSFVKSGGSAAQILAADGSVITAGTGITISGGVISSTGGGGSYLPLTGGTVTGQTNFSAGTGGSSGQNTVVGVQIQGLSAYASLELGVESNYTGVIRSYGNDIRYYAGHWRTVGTASSEDHSHYWYTSKNGSTNWSTAKMQLDQDGTLSLPLGQLVMGTSGTSYIRMGRFPQSTSNSGEAWIGRAADRSTGSMTVQLGGSSNASFFEVVDYGWTTVTFKAGMNDFSYKGNAILHAGNYTSYSPSLTGSGASGTWGINVSGTAAQLGGYSLEGGTSVATRIFNNKGQNHTTNTNFNTVMTPGPNYMQQGTNGPTGTASHQWYGFMFGLGGEYGTSTGSTGNYGSQLYYARAQQGGDQYLYARDLENGSWGSWRKLYAGYADSAGSASSAGYANAVYLGGSSSYTITNSAWAGSGGYHGYTFTGGNYRFGFSSTSGVIDVYADGNFYATDNSYLVLHAGNYNSYAPTLTGGNASGTWGINITGNSSTTDRVYPFGAAIDSADIGYGLRVWYDWAYSGTYRNGITIGSNPGDQAYGFQLWQNMWDERTYTRRKNGGWQATRTLLTAQDDNYAYNMNQYVRSSDSPSFSAVYASNWFRSYGWTGLYNQDYGTHFRPNASSSYGTWEIFGWNKGGYGGVLIQDPQGYYNNMMFENGNGGHYQENGAGWGWYYNRGSDCFAPSSSTTSPSYRFLNDGHGQNRGDWSIWGFTGMADVQIGGTHYWNGNYMYEWRDWGGWGSYWFYRNGGDIIGQLYAIYTVTGSISDMRYKKDVTALPYGLNEVMKMNPIKYHYNLPKESMLANDPDFFLGFSAQEIQSLVPEAVHEQMGYEEGDSMHGSLAITYNELIPVCVQAIKDQQVIIQNQSTKIAILESKINQLLNN